MSASRMSTRALATLKRTSLTKSATRSLSMTGPTTFSSLLTSDKPAVRSRGPRLPSAAEETTESDLSRQFNTSRSLKAVNDTSTIDFMFIPDFDPDTGRAPVAIRVPILPFNQASESVKESLTEAEKPVMMPTIYTVSADGTHIHAPSAMSDMTDSDHIDFQGMASKVKAQLGQPVEDGQSMVKQVWTGLLDDILGPSNKHART